jgi:hypothetical protein
VLAVEATVDTSGLVNSAVTDGGRHNRGTYMRLHTRLAALAAFCVVSGGAAVAQANPLSLLVACPNETLSQPFAHWGDNSDYTPVPGGSFETGTPAWTLTHSATVVSGNETSYVGGASQSKSLSLPSGSSGTSPSMCTSIFDPTARLFVRNTGKSSSQLTVQALYPGLLGGTQTTTIGVLKGSSTWEPAPAMTLLLGNLLATLSLDSTKIAFRFTPADNTGDWQIDDVYLDPYGRG